MNNRHIENLTHRLLQALDSNYDVINMDAVLSVIAALESTTITKEQLEATRLAKYINLFRRRTNSEQLAKRAKSLLKKWREMVGIQQPVAGPSSTGIDLQYTKPTSPLASSSGAGGNGVGSAEKQSRWNMREESNEPTSFVNLIPNISSTYLNHNSSTANQPVNGPRAGRKNRNPKNHTEVTNSDLFANSNSMNVNTITPTIVIDIEDSNSGSNVIEKQDDVVIIGETTKASPEIKPTKHKKTKKEKKKPRTAREMPTTLVVIDAESSESQHPADRAKSTVVAATEKVQDKTKNSLMTTNMSEILSLSNSSVSCVFPTSMGGVGKLFSSQQPKAPKLTESELSFAGKFGGAGANAGPSTFSGDIFAFNENSNIASSAPVPKTSGKSRVFGGSGYNSNDSVSSSRHSNFENVEGAGPGTSHAPANIASVVADTATPAPLEKLPKKRGRKKGSKGVDSLIAKDTSLSSQMLMQSLSGGNKKVKTTKELYAEMQNRKLGVSTPTTPSHWTSGSSQPVVSQQSRRDSFCSEPSLHSPRTFDACSTNATISTIATSSTTPDKNASASRKCFDTGVVDVDSTSDSLNSGVTSRASVVQENTPKVLAAVDQQLLDLAHKLPPVPSVSEIEKTCADEIVPCTCKIVELMPEQPENVAEQASAAMGDLLSLDKLKNSNLTAGEDTEMPVITISVAGNSSGNEVTVVEPKEPVKPKKSIFDLDFDEDEDPLNTLIAEVAAASAVSSSVDISKLENDSPYESKQESEQNAELPLDQTSSQIFHAPDSSAEPVAPPVPLFPTYKVEEDELCPAKERFELQTQQITGFHINLLHNFFIPNVNGNWSDPVGSMSAEIDAKKSSFQVIDGLNVVPKLSDEDHIRKDLREFCFRRKLKPKPLEITSKYETPFLGVARCLTKTHRKTRKHRQRKLENDSNEVSSKPLDVKECNTGDNITGNALLVEESAAEMVDIDLKQEDTPKSWNLPVSNQKPALEAITVNVDNDTDNVENTECSVDSQNLLAIASNVVSFSPEEAAEVMPAAHNFETTLQTNAASDELDIPKISGDFLNNNNKSCSSKFEEEPSSCESNSSLKQTQNSINQKLRKHRLRQKRQLELEQSLPRPTKRKRRRKKLTPPIKIKCIKIAINGGITTQRHIKIASSNSGSSTEVNSNDDESVEEEIEDEDGESDVSNNRSDAEETACAEELNEDFANAGETLNDDNEFDIACGDEDYEHDDENGEYIDEDEGDDYIGGDYHEVVTRDLSPSTSLGNNHIVLTIKKTPSKTNSPASNSPNVINQTTIANTNLTKQTTDPNDTKLQENSVFKDEPLEIEPQIGEGVPKQMPSNNVLAAAYAALIKDQSVRRRFRRRRRKRKCQDPLQFRFPEEVCSEGSRIFKKKHQQLFFPEEIYTRSEEDGDKHRILNMSSCSSSCYESSEFEYESNSSDEETKSKMPKIARNGVSCKPSEFSSSSSSDSATDSEEDNAESSIILESTSSAALENCKHEANEDELSEHNNGLLISFNDICVPEKSETKLSLTTTETDNCSADLTKAPLSNLKPRPEFCTGIRTVDKPMVPESNSESSNRTQQFKEWHQVLQLRSYNDEPLTVLPYVVLD